MREMSNLYRKFVFSNMSIQNHDQYKSSSSAINVAVIGATGSIGESALDVIEKSEGRLRAHVLTANTSIDKLVKLALRFQPELIVVGDENVDRSPLSELPNNIKVCFGKDSLDEVVKEPEIDVVLISIVGIAGLHVTLSALEAGKTIALANKESLVAGGAIIEDLLDSRGGKLIPVDSEHSAIYQCLISKCAANSPRITSTDVKRLILTASGGPFRDYSHERLRDVTPEEALKHPTWNMGKKITIDSATMMNKALEIIEARWLFGVDVDKISVVIHPQSLIHSMVEFVDGATIAQLSPPDMRLPIQYALYGNKRKWGPSRTFDWTQAYRFEFIPPDYDRFPALLLGKEVARKGGTAGVVLNAANEVLVDAFLKRLISFEKIPYICKRILELHNFDPKPCLDYIFELDNWARKETMKWICR